MVDEVNDITREMRQDVDVKFDIDFAWDVFRKPQDVLVIRLMQLMPSVGPDVEPDAGAQLLAYWSYPKFCARLSDIRTCYDEFTRLGRWAGPGHPFGDPWSDPSLAEIRHFFEMASRPLACAPNPISQHVPSDGSSSVAAYTCAVADGKDSVDVSTAPPTTAAAPKATMALGGSASLSVDRGQRRQTLPRNKAGNYGSSNESRKTGSAVLGARSGPPPPTVAQGSSPRTQRTDDQSLGAVHQASPESGRNSRVSRVDLSRLGHSNSGELRRPNNSTGDVGHASLNAQVQAHKKEVQQQSADIRRLKHELAQVERERCLQTELVETLRSQLSDKEELIAALRCLVRPQSCDRLLCGNPTDGTKSACELPLSAVKAASGVDQLCQESCQEADSTPAQEHPRCGLPVAGEAPQDAHSVVDVEAATGPHTPTMPSGASLVIAIAERCENMPVAGEPLQANAGTLEKNPSIASTATPPQHRIIPPTASPPQASPPQQRSPSPLRTGSPHRPTSILRVQPGRGGAVEAGAASAGFSLGMPRFNGCSRSRNGSASPRQANVSGTLPAYSQQQIHRPPGLLQTLGPLSGGGSPHSSARFVPAMAAPVNSRMTWSPHARCGSRHLPAASPR